MTEKQSNLIDYGLEVEERHYLCKDCDMHLKSIAHKRYCPICMKRMTPLKENPDGTYTDGENTWRRRT